MADDATIGIKIETVSIERGKKSLADLAAMGGVVETSMEGIETSTASAGTAVGGLATKAGAAGQSLRTAAADIAAINAKFSGLSDVAATAKATLGVLGGLSQDVKLAVAALNQMNASLAALVTASNQAATASSSFQTQVKNQTQAMGQQAAAAQASAKAVGALQAQVGSPSQTAAFVGQLSNANQALAKTGVSAGQTTAALRQLPAQFTDIATQLAGGQNPLLVLLQQGGQIKDSFGGVKEALSGLASVITPMKLAIGAAVAVVGAFAFAMVQASNESKALNQALAFTGNASGQTANKIRDLADAQSQVAGTRGKALEALTALAATGNVAGEVFAKAANAAIQLERAGGPAIDETVKKFADLGRAPVQALVKLNESENFLTKSLFDQVNALQQQGRMAEAAAAAQTGYADAVAARAKSLTDNLGTLQKAWISVGDFAKKAWDAMLNVGRPTSAGDQIKALTAQLIDVSSPRGETQRLNNGVSLEQQKASNAAIQAQIDLLKQAQKEDAKLADLDAKRANQGRALAESQKYIDATRSSAEKLTEEITKTRNVMEQAGASAGEIGKALDYITSHAAATQQALAAQSASVEASAAIATAKLTSQQDTLDNLRQRGLIRENDFIQRSSDLRLKALDNEKTKLENLLSIASKRPENSAEQISLAGQIRVVDISKLNEEKRARDEITASIEGQRRAQTQLLLAYEAEGEAQISAQIEQQAQQRAALRESIEGYARSVNGSIAATKIEAATLGQSAQVRQLAIEKLRVQLDLQERIRQINATPFDSQDDRAAEIQRVTNLAQKSIDDLTSRANIRAVEDLLDPTRAINFGNSLSDAFGKAGDSLDKFVRALGTYGAKQNAINDQIARTKKDTSLDESTRQKALAKLQEKSNDNLLAQFTELSGAAKGFFNEQSRGYKTLEGVERVFTLVQLAQSAQRSAAAAIEAVLTQAQGDPYTAFARMAAMAAIVAALGYAIGGGFNTSAGGVSAADRQKTQGTGTVFGDSEAKSESIAKSIEALKDTANAQLKYQSGMLSALRSIEANIAGLANLIVRTVGLTTGSNFGVQTGTLSYHQGSYLANKTGDPVLKGLNSIALQDPIFGDLIGGLQKAFGKVTQEITDSGLAIQGAVAQLQGGGGIQQYADVKTTSSSFFGLVKNSTANTLFQSVDEQIARQFGLIFTNLQKVLESAGGALGKDTAVIAKTIQDFVVDLPRVSLLGLKGQDLQDALNAVISAQSDTIAKAVLPGLDDFQAIGEGYLQTVVRVAGAVEQAGVALDKFGIHAIDLSLLVEKQGDVAAGIFKQSVVNAETFRFTADDAGNPTDGFVNKDGTAIRNVLEQLSGVGKIFENLSGDIDDLIEAYTALKGVEAALKNVGAAFNDLSATMIQGAGTLDDLRAGLDSYFDKFFTASEQTAAKTARLSERFEQLGLALPTSNEAFRDLVEGIDTSTDSGQKLFGQLVTLSGAFADLYPLVQKTASAVDLTNAQRQQEIQIQQLLGNSAGALALQREDELASLDPLLVAKQKYIYQLQDEQAASQAAAQAAAIVSQQRISLENTLLQLQGNTAELRARELASIDASNKALQESIYALQDKQAADAAAAQAMQAAAAEAERLAQAAQAAADALASQRKALEDQIFQLENAKNVGALRERELAALDASLRPLQERIYALQDASAAEEAANAAQQQAQQAAEAAANAADQLAQAWKGVADGLLKEVDRIRNELSGDASLGLAALQSKFAITTAQARAGSQQAGNDLPGISQALLDQAKASASSEAQFRTLQAQTAASLQVTADMANAFGARGGVPYQAGTPDQPSYTVQQPQTIFITSDPAAHQEITALKTELAAMREENTAATVQIAANTRIVAQLLRSMTGDGGDTMAISTRPGDVLAVTP